MKKTTFIILFAIMISISCIFYACNTTGGLFDKNQNTETADNDYTEMIRELEDRIIELQQNQYISEAERKEEIVKLEAIISQLKGEGSNDDTDTDTDTSNDTSSDTDSSSKEEATEPTAKFLYSVENNEATITGFSGNVEILSIPSSIDGYTVVAIGESAFSSNSITEVIIPNTVKKIGWFAFEKCESLKSLTLTESVTSIGYSAFPSNIRAFSIICPENSFAAEYADSYGISRTSI